MISLIQQFCLEYSGPYIRHMALYRKKYGKLQVMNDYEEGRISEDDVNECNIM